jgi:polyvinyl alcohol dehydrogenase (cytochrome)
LSDVLTPGGGGGLFALKVATGDKIWYAAPQDPACKSKKGCSPAQMAPATLISGAVFSGSMDGHLRAYSTLDGKVIWDFDTLRDFDTVNGVKAHGGSMNATGPTIADGMMFVNSGYAQLTGMSGNVLLAFSK